MKLLLPFLAICLTSIIATLNFTEKYELNTQKTSVLDKLDFHLLKVPIDLKTHSHYKDYAFSPENFSSGMDAFIHNFFTISRGVELPIQSPQELFTPSILQIKTTIITI